MIDLTHAAQPIRCGCLAGAITLLILAGCKAAPPAAPSPALHGKYRVTASHQKDDFDEPFDQTAVNAVLARGGHAGDTFAGSHRGNAKTSVATGSVETFATITDVKSTLQSDQDMLGLGITEATDSPRAPQEQRNVTVGAVIYAISKESDNDFHLITGDPNCLMNVEISGLPKDNSPDAPTLKAVRSKFLNFFGGTDPGTSGGYDKFDPPIAVTVTGALFFDIDHKAGVVGPAGMRPNSAWEIHPVTAITFGP